MTNEARTQWEEADARFQAAEDARDRALTILERQRLQTAADEAEEAAERAWEVYEATLPAENRLNQPKGI